MVQAKYAVCTKWLDADRTCFGTLARSLLGQSDVSAATTLLITITTTLVSTDI